MNRAYLDKLFTVVLAGVLAGLALAAAALPAALADGDAALLRAAPADAAPGFASGRAGVVGGVAAKALIAGRAKLADDCARPAVAQLTAGALMALPASFHFQRRMAASIFRCGQARLALVPSRLKEIAEANSRTRPCDVSFLFSYYR